MPLPDLPLAPDSMHVGGHSIPAWHGLPSDPAFACACRCYSLAPPASFQPQQLTGGFLSGEFGDPFWLCLSPPSSSLHKPVSDVVAQGQAHKSPIESALVSGSFTFWWMLQSSLTWPNPCSNTHGWVLWPSPARHAS